MYRYHIKGVWFLILTFCIVTIICYLSYLHDESIFIDEKYEYYVKNNNLRLGNIAIKSKIMLQKKDNKLLPRGIDDRRDRISEQLLIQQPVQSPRKPKIIVQYPYIFREKETYFVDNDCPVKDCILSSNWSMLHEENVKVDAVIFGDQTLEDKMPPKLPGQIWILRMLECPFYTYPLKKVDNKINWTATYRFDSTISTPYFKYVSNKFPKSKSVNKNFAEGKTKLVAWFVSNCGDKSGRMKYLKDLQNYIDVDIYGHCGDMRCDRDNENCDEMLGKKYKFYIAFENSKCRHYITEKPYNHALEHNVIPVVMGAPYKDYKLLLPPDSFIHVDNFTSPRALADFLLHLDKDDVMYNQYFRWQTQGEFIDSKYMCRVCAMLHESLPNIWYDDIQSWWKDGVCTEP